MFGRKSTDVNIPAGCQTIPSPKKMGDFSARLRTPPSRATASTAPARRALGDRTPRALFSLLRPLFLSNFRAAAIHFPRPEQNRAAARAENDDLRTRRQFATCSVSNQHVLRQNYGTALRLVRWLRHLVGGERGRRQHRGHETEGHAAELAARRRDPRARSDPRARWNPLRERSAARDQGQKPHLQRVLSPKYESAFSTYISSATSNKIIFPPFSGTRPHPGSGKNLSGASEPSTGQERTFPRHRGAAEVLRIGAVVAHGEDMAVHWILVAFVRASVQYISNVIRESVAATDERRWFRAVVPQESTLPPSGFARASACFDQNQSMARHRC